MPSKRDDAGPARGAPLHPFFRGLLEALPEPGAPWPPAQREQWLETARNIFALLYAEAEGPPGAPLQQPPSTSFNRRIV